MYHTRRKTAFFLGYLIAVVGTGLLGSVMQTQLNLARLRDIGPPVDLLTRWHSTWYDIIHFSPLLMLLSAVTFALALPVAHLVTRWQLRQYAAWCGLSGAAGFYVMLQVIDGVAPMPTLIAATRATPGLLLIVGCGFVGGLLYAWSNRYLRHLLRYRRVIS